MSGSRLIFLLAFAFCFAGVTGLAGTDDNARDLPDFDWLAIWPRVLDLRRLLTPAHARLRPEDRRSVHARSRRRRRLEQRRHPHCTKSPTAQSSAVFGSQRISGWLTRSNPV